ncbi:hypothetical protein PoB_000051600 [Plakobranchus ocellatus]|uniref:Uncharacterized protein n=1 Tax=Plakobranchus ocellatus TaxID=259542 RepID=A0AAV3XSS5_9GAST|nr:hypothetical protein PoB_000051600 [Plakobranchus ocellatus]
MTDNDGTTCNPNSDETTIRLMMPKARLSHWIRLKTNYIERKGRRECEGIHVDLPISSVVTNELKLLFATSSDPEDLKGCEVKVIKSRPNLFFDMYCITKIAMSYIIIQGPVVARLCDIYVSEGRQVSLKRSPSATIHSGEKTQSSAKVASDASYACTKRQHTPNNNSKWTFDSTFLSRWNTSSSITSTKVVMWYHDF